MTHPILTPVSRTLLAAGVLLASLPSYAQAQDPNASSEKKSTGIQEVVVTATKVLTPASKTPVALSVLGGDLRFQALPNPFDLWVDGLEVPVFEEFAAEACDTDGVLGDTCFFVCFPDGSVRRALV